MVNDDAAADAGHHGSWLIAWAGPGTGHEHPEVAFQATARGGEGPPVPLLLASHAFQLYH